uniref:Uncharacterized protein LOC102803075 n=1 Tax=Saccoglossus kowalevskii TaxID=10224 RepID=A0ABM0MQL5_SACKO|nr:PREDICTED: uncharacterized protein LOC102803075 [Saccoglossus kowalevskii]
MDFDITRPDSSTITEYQRERTEAWRKTGVVVSVTPSPTPRVSLQGRISPPPQRPSSPLSSTSRSIYKPRPNPKTGTMLYIKSANDWLGGGRNLHYMAAGQRPKSGHVPGYLEGMEPRMRSLQANRFRNRPSKSAGLSRSNSRSGNRLHRSMETLMPDYVQQSRQHPMRQLGNPSYGSPKRPPSPLNMTYR